MKYEDVKVGQRVRYVGKRATVTGLIGTCIYKNTDIMVTVEFDSPLNIFHTCMGRCKENRGYWCQAGDLEPISVPCNTHGTAEDAENLEHISVPLNVPGVADYARDMGECISGLDVLGLKRHEISNLFGDILSGYFHEKVLQNTIKRLEGESKGV